MLDQLCLLFLFLFALLVSLQANFEIERVPRSRHERATTLVVYSVLPLVAVLVAVAYRAYTADGVRLPRAALVFGLLVSALVLSMAFQDSQVAFEIFFVILTSALLAVLVTRNYRSTQIAGGCLVLLIGVTMVVTVYIVSGASAYSLERLAKTISAAICLGLLFLLQERFDEQDVLALFALCGLFSPLLTP